MPSESLNLNNKKELTSAEKARAIEDAKKKALDALKQKVVIVNAEHLAEVEARDAADAYMTESKGKAGFFKKLWKHTFFDEYYRQKELNKVRNEIIEKDNIYTAVEKDKKAHDGAMQAITTRFASEYDEAVNKNIGEEKKMLSTSDPKTVEAKVKIKKLITDYATGKFDEAVFKSEKNKIIDNMNHDLLKGANTYADNLFEIAKNAKLAIEHGAKLEELDYDFDLIVGKAKSSIKTEAKNNWIDSAVSGIKKTAVGKFVNPATLSLALGIAYSIGVGTGKLLLRSKASQIATLGGTAVLAGAFAAVNESQRLAAERRQHGREMAKGGQIEKDSPRRESMEKYAYQTESANILIQNLRDSLFIKDANGKEVAKEITQAELDTVMGNISNIEARNAIADRKKIDLISYSTIGNVEKERTELTILLARAKVELQKQLNGKLKGALPAGENFDTYLAKQIDVTEKAFFGGEKGINSKDSAFSNLKLRRSALAFGKTLLSGLVIGGVIQEVVAGADALWDGQREGLVEGLIHQFKGEGITENHIQTPLEHVRGWLTGAPSHLSGNIEHLVGGMHINLPEGVNILQNPDGTFNIVDGDHVISDHIPLHFDASGNLDADSLNRLGADGVIANTTHNIIDSTKEVTTSAEDYVKNHPEGTTHIARDGWYGNDTPKPIFDQNELKLWWGGDSNTGLDANGNYVFDASHMTSGGSFQDGLSVDAQEKIKNGGLKMLLSLTQGTQNQVFEVPIDVNGIATIDPDSEVGKLFFSTENGKAIFHGRFAEVAESFGTHDGAEHVKILATHVGEGLDGIKDIVKDHTDIPIYHFDTPLDTEPPYFIPLVARTPLEPIKYKDFNTGDRGNPYGYGYGGESKDFGLLDRALYSKRLSKKLRENSEFDLSGNDMEVIEEYLNKQDKGYLKELEKLISGASKISTDIETVITIPAYQEGKNIEKTIRNYAKLKNRKNFELVILENHPKDKARDNTGAEIARMKKEFPDMNIIHLYKIFDKKPPIGEVRKYLVDSVLLRKKISKIEKSLAIVSNDADLEDIKENYANDIANAFKKNKKLDAIAGKWDFPEKDFAKLPILHASQRLWHYFDIIFRNNYMKSPELIGRNSAFRSGIYAAIGGYNKESKLAEDLEIGWLIKDARKYDTSRISYLNTASLVSNSRRAVTTLLSGRRLVEQYGDFHENEEVREKSIAELLKDKKDFNPETFKKEVQAIYDYYNKWKKSKNGWIDDHFVNETFDRAMRFTGVEYKINGDSIEITNISKLLDGLNGKKEVKKPVKEFKKEPVKSTSEIISPQKAKENAKLAKEFIKMLKMNPDLKSKFKKGLQKYETIQKTSKDYNKLTSESTRKAEADKDYATYLTIPENKGKDMSTFFKESTMIMNAEFAKQFLIIKK